MRFTSLFLRTSLWLLVIFVFLSACVGEQCETVSDPVMRVSFARFTDAERTEEQAISVSFNYFYGLGSDPARKDSLVKDTSSIAGLRIPLSQLKDASTFVVKRNGNGFTQEIITFTYTRKPYFISQACGFEMAYENLDVEEGTYTNIAEMRVVQPSVNAQTNETNVKIYFK
jgi:hypothetical protein